MSQKLDRLRLHVMGRPATRPPDDPAILGLVAAMQEAFSPENCQLDLAWEVGSQEPAPDAHLFLPDADGHLMPPPQNLEGDAPQVAYVPLMSAAPLPKGYDALFFPHGSLLEAARGRQGFTETAKHFALRFPAALTAAPRAAGGRPHHEEPPANPTVLIDLRDGFEAVASRVVTQISLLKAESNVVFLLPEGHRATQRVHDLCDGLGVSAFAFDGQDLGSALGHVDIWVGTPRWAEFLLAAACGVNVLWLGEHSARLSPILEALVDGGAMGEVQSRLQLAARLDATLKDPAAAGAEGMVFRYELTGPAAPVIEVLRTLKPAKEKAGPPWQAVGKGAQPFATEAEKRSSLRPGKVLRPRPRMPTSRTPKAAKHIR